MNDKEKETLAKHLAGLKYKRARAEIRKLDTDAVLKYWRNAIHKEWHTLYELPNVGLRVTLVEIPKRTPIQRTERHIAQLERVEPEYVEARVEDL